MSPVDRSGGPPRPDDAAVAVKPGFAHGVAAQVAALVVGEQRTQVQVGDALVEVEVHDHGGVLPVGAAGDLGVPAGVDQVEERIHGGGQRGSLIGDLLAVGTVAVGVVGAVVVVVVVFPRGDQGVVMGLQGSVELRRVQPGQGDAPGGVFVVGPGGLGDRSPGLGSRRRVGLGFEFDCGA